MRVDKKIIFWSVLVVGAVLLWRFIKPAQAPIVVDQLSPRAAEFIADQRSDGTGLWNQVNLEKTQQPQNQTTPVTTECFSLTLPFRTSNSHQSFANNYCTWRAKIISPLSYVALASYPAAGFETDSGIVLRRKDPARYTETNLVTTQFAKASLFRSQSELLVFAFQNQRMFTLALTELAQPSGLTETEITALINSVTLKSLPEVTLTPVP